MLEDPDHDDLVKSPQLQGSYPPQFGDTQAPRHADYFPPSQAMQQGHQQQMSTQPKYEHGQVMPPTSHPADTDGQFDPSDPMLDADPFGLSASMNYPTNYAFEQQQQHQQMQR